MNGARPHILPGALALALVFVAAPAAAQGSISADDANQVANAIDGDIAQMRAELSEIDKGYAISSRGEVGRVARRLREGEIHFLLKDYLRAAIVLLDVVEDDAYTRDPRYDDAVFLLAESLRLSRNFSGAKRYYEQVLPRAQGDRLEEVVLGLLQIAGETQDYGDVDRHVARLRQAGTMSRPDVDYIYGKMLFKNGLSNPDKMTRAYELFTNIPAGTAVSARGTYYAGVALVQLGRYEEALAKFDATLGRISDRPEDDGLRELTYLSLGRLHNELGDVTKAADAYQEIAQDSPYFSDMLFEVAWAHVTSANLAEAEEDKRAAFVRALRALELLMATAPESRLYPEARILQGNLQIRLGARETAYDTFQTIVDDYGGAKAKIERMIEGRTDTQQFFRDLIASDLDAVRVRNVLPPLAVTWALEEDDMERAVAMEQDLTEAESFLKESRELVSTLEAALQSEQRFNMFPGLKEARSKAISVENRVVDGKRRLLALERAILAPHLAAAQRAEVDRVHEQAEALEGEIAALPMTDAAVDATREQIRQSYLSAGRRAHKLQPRITGMRAELIAVELWMRDHRDTLDAEEQAIMDTRIAEARAEVAALERELAAVEGDVRQAATVVEGDAGRGRARRLAREYDQLVGQEVRLLAQSRSAAPGDVQGVLSRIDQQRAALAQIDARLTTMQTKLDAEVRDKVDEIRRTLAQEIANLETHADRHQRLSAQTQALLEPVADRTLAAVGRQFRELVLKADVGIIDVAWARKQSETQKVNELIREQQRRSQELELEFADFLKE